MVDIEKRDKREIRRLKILKTGNAFLILFLISTILLIPFLSFGFLGWYAPIRGSLLDEPIFWISSLLLMILAESILFWIGILMVYTTSIQLGIETRIMGIALGWAPIANIVMLIKILRITGKEISFENQKLKINEKRFEEQVCKTKYPILLVHGVFFRDFKHFNYWGRIPAELEKNGAVIYYGNHNSAASVDDSAKELTNRILEILKETGAEKLNVIAHSKGGLDMRTAIQMGCAPYIASLTTINTPHRGCEFADYLLSKIPAAVRDNVARTYNAAAAKLGDVNPDFLAAVYDLTSSSCAFRNKWVKDSPEVYYQSVGSKMKHASNGKFPLNYSYHLVKYFDGPNDGLVGEKSFAWGRAYTFLSSKGDRGISHGDMIDLNRENIDGFDVREFYVKLVNDLKLRGF